MNCTQSTETEQCRTSHFCVLPWFINDWMRACSRAATITSNLSFCFDAIGCVMCCLPVCARFFIALYWALKPATKFQSFSKLLHSKAIKCPTPSPLKMSRSTHKMYRPNFMSNFKKVFVASFYRHLNKEWRIKSGMYSHFSVPFILFSASIGTSHFTFEAHTAASHRLARKDLRLCRNLPCSTVTWKAYSILTYISTQFLITTSCSDDPNLAQHVQPEIMNLNRLYRAKLCTGSFKCDWIYNVIGNDRKLASTWIE